MAYEELEDNSQQINEIESEFLQEFNEYLYQILLCLDALLDVFGLSKITLNFNVCDPEPDRPEEYRASRCQSMVIYRDQSIGELPKPQCPGYDFAGWFTSTHYNEEIKDYDNASFSDSNITLYAKWVYGYVKVNLDAGNGTVYPDYVNIRYMSKFGNILPEPTNPAERFEFWYDSDDFNPEIKITPNTVQNKYLEYTVHAKYEELYWKLTFDTNGGIGDPPNAVNCKPDEPVDLSVIEVGDYLLKPGYVFGGWSETKNSPVTIDEDNPLVLWQDTVIYAYWIPIQYEMEYVNTEAYNENKSGIKLKNMIYGEAVPLDPLKKLNIFTSEQINNFEYWKFGLKRIPNEEYVVNLCKVENDKAQIFSITGNETDAPFNKIYAVSVLTFVRPLDETIDIEHITQEDLSILTGNYTEQVDAYCRSVFKNDSIFCYANLEGVFINQLGFEYEECEGADETDDILTAEITANHTISRKFGRKVFKLNYCLRSDKTKFNYETISTFNIPFDTSFAEISNQIKCDPYKSADYSKQFYKFEDWYPIFPERMPAKDISVYTQPIMQPGSMTVRYYINNNPGFTTAYKSQEINFGRHSSPTGDLYYGACTVLNNPFKWEGHSFQFWSIEPETILTTEWDPDLSEYISVEIAKPLSDIDSSHIVNPGDSLSIYGDMSLYAIWNTAKFDISVGFKVIGDSTSNPLHTNLTSNISVFHDIPYTTKYRLPKRSTPFEKSHLNLSDVFDDVWKINRDNHTTREICNFLVSSENEQYKFRDNDLFNSGDYIELKSNTLLCAYFVFLANENYNETNIPCFKPAFKFDLSNLTKNSFMGFNCESNNSNEYAVTWDATPDTSNDYVGYSKWSIVDPENIANYLYSDDETVNIAKSISVYNFAKFGVNSELSIMAVMNSNNITAFEGYKKLRGISIAAFQNSNNLLSVILNGVYSINQYAFANCNKLKDVYFNNLSAIQYIAPTAFQSSLCAWFHGNLTNSNNTKYYIDNNTNGNHHILYKAKTSSVDYNTNPYSIVYSNNTSIAFNNNTSIRQIMSESFSYDYNLTSIYIDKKVTNIGIDAFAYCKNLKSISCTYDNISAVTGIAKTAFGSNAESYVGSNVPIEDREVKITDSSELSSRIYIYDNSGNAVGINGNMAIGMQALLPYYANFKISKMS